MLLSVAAPVSFTLNTVKGRIRLALLVVLVTTVAFISVVLYRVISTLQSNVYHMSVVKPVQYYSADFANAVNASFADLNAYMVYGMRSYRNQSMYVLRNQAQAAFDSLSGVAENLRHGPTEIHIRDLEVQFFKLKESYQVLATLEEEPEQFRNYVSATVYPQVRRINRLAADIQEIQRQRIARASESNEFGVSNILIINLIFVILLSLSLLAIGSGVIRHLNERIATLHQAFHALASGNLLTYFEEVQDEFDQIWRSAVHLNQELRNIKHFAADVGAKRYDSSVKVFDGEGELGEALTAMRDSLREVDEAERRRQWESEGINLITDVIRKHFASIDRLCDHTLSSLIHYAQASQGAIFLYENKKLNLRACYAYNRKKHLQLQIEEGEGLNGEVFRDGQTVILTDIPRQYPRIAVGVGALPPRSIAIIPLTYQNIRVGVLEMASLEKFEAYHIRFLERISEILAANILAVQNNEKTQHLLEEANQQAEKLQMQDEELRQKALELENIRRELEKNTVQMQRAISTQNEVFIKNAWPMLLLDPQGRILNITETACDYLQLSRRDALQDLAFRFIPSLRDIMSVAKEGQDFRRKWQGMTQTAEQQVYEAHFLLSSIRLSDKTCYLLIMVSEQGVA